MALPPARPLAESCESEPTVNETGCGGAVVIQVMLVVVVVAVLVVVVTLVVVVEWMVLSLNNGGW